MNQSNLDQLSKILLEIENDAGTTNLTVTMLDMFFASIKQSEDLPKEEMMKKIDTFIHELHEVRPRIAIVLHYFDKLGNMLFEHQEEFDATEDILYFIKKTIRKFKTEIEEDAESIYRHGADLIKDGSTIMIHDYSNMISGILLEAKKQGKKFKLIVLEQKIEITERIILFLQENDIEFFVVPEYMISHVEEEVDAFFMGCTSLTKKFQFVGAPGSNEIVSELAHAKKKTYAFLSTKKYSLWESTMLSDHSKPEKQERKPLDKAVRPYPRMKYSHDRIDVSLFSSVVNENGVFSPEEIHAQYAEMYHHKGLWREKYYVTK